MQIDIKRYSLLSSTNDTAKALGINGSPEGTAVLADAQTCGRGRMGRTWISDKGSFFSVILRPQMRADSLAPLTLIAGIAACRALSRICGLFFRLKWPNDIYVNNKKISGILTELNTAYNFVVVGIGVNVNTENFENELNSKATSLFIETNKVFDTYYIADIILNEFSVFYEAFIEAKSFKPFATEYRKLCFNINTNIINSGELFFCKDISDNGELIVSDESGKTRLLSSGEINFIK